MICTKCNGFCLFDTYFNEWCCINCGKRFKSDTDRTSNYIHTFLKRSFPNKDFHVPLPSSSPKIVNPDPQPGDKINSWTVLKKTKIIGLVKKFRIKCSCGFKTYKSKKELYLAKTCWNCWVKKFGSDLKPGSQFGEWKVLGGFIKYHGNKKFKVQCSCGFITHILKVNLVRKKTMRCNACRLKKVSYE